MKTRIFQCLEVLVFFLMALALGWLAMTLISSREPTVQTGDFQQYFQSSPHKVIVFGTEQCPYCRKVRELLTQKAVAFEMRDIANSQEFRQEFEALNGKHVPLILIGHTRINGFVPDEIERALSVRNKTE